MIAETVSLARYAWTRNRTSAIAVLAVALLGEVVALSSPLVSGVDAPTSATGVLLILCLAPCWLYALVFFDYGNRSDLLSTDGGYDRWLLQLPLPTWKLALIPAALVTLWMTCTWMVFALTVRVIGGPLLPLFQQALALGAAAIWVSSLAWRPQRRAWQRLATLVASVPLLYLVMTFILIVEFEAPQWRSAAAIAAVLCFVAANANAVRSVALARISAFQQRRSAASPSAPVAVDDAESSATRTFATAASALNWHDLYRTHRTRFLTLAAFALTLGLLIVLLLPVSGGTAIFGLVMVAAVASSAAVSTIESPVARGESSLPGYLIASPLPSLAIARARLGQVARTHCWNFFLLSLLLPLSLIWESNRDTMARWFTSPEWTSAGTDPLRVMLLFYLGVLAVSLGFALRHSCCQFYGQQWLVLTLILALATVFIIPFAMAIGWFLDQSDWITVRDTVTRWQRRSVNLLWIALALKLMVFLAACVATHRHRRDLRRGLPSNVATWVAVVMMLAVVLRTLWPAEFWPAGSFHFGWSLALAALVVPLATIVVAPLAVDANRHRGNHSSHRTALAHRSGS